MRWRRCGLLCVIVRIGLGAQGPADVPPDATFRATTKLVQLSVIARDKQGKPVADLRRNEFQIFDNGSPREIQLFVAETGKSSPSAAEVKERHTFTNQIASSSSFRSGYSVILIDNLLSDFGDPFTQEEGSGLARQQTLKMLGSMPAGERIAIYALGRKLQVICEFTGDRDLLERHLKKWTPHVDTPVTSRVSGAFPIPSTSPGGNIGSQQQPRGDAAAEAARIDTLQRASASNDEMEAVANHLAGIPGRKNLIWIASQFVINARALRTLNGAGVAIYPVDVDGVCHLCPPRPTQVMNSIAALTGGVAYYSRNDLDAAMREAIDDGRVSYTLGFYQAGEDDKAAIHQVAVRVSRPDLSLRYRNSYQTEAVPERPPSVQDLVLAMNHPVDATAIGITASATHAQDRLDLSVSLDVSSLDLELTQGLWKGAAELVARFVTADGLQAGDLLSQTVTLNLPPAAYASMSQSGVPYHRELRIPPKAVELKLLVGNLASGKIGTLTIPLSQK